MSPRTVAAATADAGGEPGGREEPTWTPRERELLATALEVVREHGYDRMTIDEVALRAQASKATVYRRWPSKAELVVAAFAESIREVAVPPHTGSLRADLLALAQLISDQLRTHASTVIGVLPEMRRNERLRAVMQQEFISARKELVQGVLSEAAERGEIARQAISDDLWDLLPGYLVFRALVPGRPVTEATLVEMVDFVLLPSLTRVCANPG